MRSVTGDRPGELWLVLVLFLISLSGCVPAQQFGGASPSGSGARLYAPEQDFHFGSTDNGPVVTHSFKLKNTGTEDVEIASVAGSCGCTAILASSSRLAPGEEGEVHVALDTYRLSGEQAKAVVVRSNDPLRPELTLMLHGTVTTDVSAAPARVYLGRVPAGAVVTQQVDVKVARPDVQITDVRSESGRFRVETAPLDAPNQGVRLRVTLLPTAESGTFDDRIVVSSTSPRQPMLTIPVLGTVERQAIYAGRHANGAATH